MNQLVEIMTVVLSVPALLLSALVLKHWFPQARKALLENRLAADWLVLGVTINFIGIILNTGYWSLFWTSTTLGWGIAPVLMDNGGIANLATRYTPVIGAAWCHLMAYHTFVKGDRRSPTTWLVWAVGFGLLIGLIMRIFTEA